MARNIIPNKKSEYQKLSELLVKGRMGGEVDWDAIEDRVRKPKLSYSVDDIPDAIHDTIDQYKLDRMDGQEIYIEVWCEKDALSGVLYRVTNKYHIRLMINRGYSSATAMYKAAKRFRQQGGGLEKRIIYLGDHDPSGLDMLRDIKDRFREFGVRLDSDNGKPDHLAITMEQIDELQPPPNYAKISDPRAEWYINEFGEDSWELDAIEPKMINEVLDDMITDLIDVDQYHEIVRQEKADKKKLEKLIDMVDEITEDDEDDEE